MNPIGIAAAVALSAVTVYGGGGCPFSAAAGVRGPCQRGRFAKGWGARPSTAGANVDAVPQPKPHTQASATAAPARPDTLVPTETPPSRQAPAPRLSQRVARQYQDAELDPEGLVAGLTNAGQNCWGPCGAQSGDCPSFCGTGQCCRRAEYIEGVDGCELAHDVTSPVCGLFRGEPGLRNEGRACMGHCGSTPGDCPGFCGTGQCCRKIDGDTCAPECELAQTAWVEGGPASQCGNFVWTTEHTEGFGSCVPKRRRPPPPAAPPGGGGTGGTPQPMTTFGPGSGLQNEGQQCYAACGFRGGDCPAFCGDGQCCTRSDWYRGVPGCELAENVTAPRCSIFKQPRPTPAEFRLPAPLGSAAAYSPAPGAVTFDSGRLGNITVNGNGEQDHHVPQYSGDGGKPWSPFEMALVRDLIVRETRRASEGRDEISTSRILRLAFHDCLRYADGTGGCDGCLNWEGVGTVLGGDNGRVEDREYEDHERKMSNNGLQETVAFLEHIYNLDLGKTWASGCWETPATVSGAESLADTQSAPLWVTTAGECEAFCRGTPGCAYFTVPNLRFVDGRGPCRIFGHTDRATVRSLGQGNLMAGRLECTHTSWSLRSVGKSRADLWAFASLVAIEEGIDRQNWACDGDRRSPYSGPTMCTQFEGEPGCKVTPSRPFVFKTGRKDCVTGLAPTFKANKTEAHPDEHFNGTMVVQFMEQQFGFTGVETVAIMGAHTMGRFHQQQNGHKYVWTTDFQAFNNQFYRNIAGRPDWFFDDDECTRVGDAWGNKGEAVWIVKMNQVYRTGAPIQWIQKKVVCPNCAARSYDRGGRHADRLAQDRDCCLNGVPEGAQCRPDGVGAPFSRAADRDDDASDGCEYSHFIFGKDETALQSDMGLMLSFDVDERGFPSGCPGLGTFFPSANRFSDWDCGIDGRPWFEDPSLAFDDPNITRVRRDGWTDRGCPTDCPRQQYTYPGEHHSLSEHVERFADDQRAWVEEFFPAMEKMIANGYGTGELVVSWPPPLDDADDAHNGSATATAPTAPPTTTGATTKDGRCAGACQGAGHMYRGLRPI